MKSGLKNLARMVYRHTPSARLKRFYLDTVYAFIRGRKIRATVDGITFDLDLSEVIDASIYLGGYEPDVNAVFERFCRPGYQVLDIGANVGAHTLRLAKLAGETGRVYAFEPMDYAYSKLVRNIALNSFKTITAFQVALSDRNLGQQKINFRSSWLTNRARNDSPTVVDFLKLDDWSARHNVDQINLIKIDVDGNEYEVLVGGYNLIKNCRPVLVMEAVGVDFEDPNRNPFALLKDLGYRFWNTLSGEEYVELDDMKKLFPPNDYEMSMSINLIASTIPLQLMEPVR
jgi:FkbM family methyltransferase